MFKKEIQLFESGTLKETDITYPKDEGGNFITDEYGNKIGEVEVTVDGSTEKVTVIQNDDASKLEQGVNVSKAWKSINDVVDETELVLLAKDVKYLPGPQLPERIASTFENGVYKNRKLISNEKFYKYHGTNNRTGKKYAWYSNKKYVTQAELREKLAIREDWGVQIEFVTEFDVPAGTWVSEGKAAAQGVGYPGQDYQAVIMNTPNAWIIRTDKAFK